MNFNFDGANKLIYLIDDGSEARFNAQELYSEWKRWLKNNPDNLKYPQAMRSIGGDPLSSVKSIAPYIEIMNGWSIKPYDGNYILSIEGNLFGTGGRFPFVNADNGTVIVSMETTGNALALSTGADNTEVLQKLNSMEIMLNLLLDIEQGNWEIKNNQMIFYDRNGNELMRFNLLDKDGQPSEMNVFKRVKV